MTPRPCAARVTESPSGSRHCRFTIPPGCGGLFIAMTSLLNDSPRNQHRLPIRLRKNSVGAIHVSHAFGGIRLNRGRARHGLAPTRDWACWWGRGVGVPFAVFYANGCKQDRPAGLSLGRRLSSMRATQWVAPTFGVRDIASGCPLGTGEAKCGLQCRDAQRCRVVPIPPRHQGLGISRLEGVALGSCVAGCVGRGRC